MNDVNIIILLAIVLSGLLFWLLIPRKKSAGQSASPVLSGGMEALPAAKHYAYFPQIRQALSPADSDYLLKNAPTEVARQALRERRVVAQHFLEGLHEDFSNLARLGRIIAALSPEVSHEQETERLILSVKFQILYAFVSLRLSAGNLPLHQLENLTGLVGRLAVQMETAMAAINALSVGQAQRQPIA
jgi:hypothetical protein